MGLLDAIKQAREAAEARKLAQLERDRLAELDRANKEAERIAARNQRENELVRNPNTLKGRIYRGSGGGGERNG